MATSEAASRGGVAWTVLAGVFCGVLLLAGWWLAGERELLMDSVAGVASVVTTPFFLEATVFVCGLSAVVAWNHWRQKKEGDGWVYLAEDENTADGAAAGRHDAVFAVAPEAEPPGLDFDILEGLLEMGAWAEAGELLVGMTHDERESTRGVAARLRLAEGLGQVETVQRLRRMRGVGENMKHET